jgi:hypothetical protein
VGRCEPNRREADNLLLHNIPSDSATDRTCVPRLSRCDGGYLSKVHSCVNVCKTGGNGLLRSEKTRATATPDADRFTMLILRHRA